MSVRIRLPVIKYYIIHHWILDTCNKAREAQLVERNIEAILAVSSSLTPGKKILMHLYNMYISLSSGVNSIDRYTY